MIRKSKLSLIEFKKRNFLLTERKFGYGGSAKKISR